MIVSYEMSAKSKKSSQRIRQDEFDSFKAIKTIKPTLRQIDRYGEICQMDS